MKLGKSFLSVAVLLNACTLLQSADGLIYSGPFIIKSGGVYIGNWESKSIDTPAVLIQTPDPVVIQNSNIRGRGILIKGFDVNLTVRNSKAYGSRIGFSSKSAGRFISVEGIGNVSVENNYIKGTGGIYINDFGRQSNDNKSVIISKNRFENIDGRGLNIFGSATGSKEVVQAVLLNNLKRPTKAEISWNQIINYPGQSSVEENINIYESSGSSNNPIRIHDNYIKGAYPVDPIHDKYSGGGIVIGDGRVDTLAHAGSFVDVYNNQIIGTSNQGIGIAGGHNQNVYENRLISSGLLADGARIVSANGGLYVWDINGGAKRQPSTFFENTVRDNIVGWTKFHSDGTAFLNNTWTPDCTPATRSVCEDNKTWPVPVTLDAEKAEYQVWLDKLKANNVTIGPVGDMAGSVKQP